MMNQKTKLTRSEIWTNVSFFVCTLTLVIVQVSSHYKLSKELSTKTEESDRKDEVRQRWRKMFESNPTLVRPLNLFPEEVSL